MTFALRRNRIMTHFSKRVPVIKRSIASITQVDYFNVLLLSFFSGKWTGAVSRFSHSEYIWRCHIVSGYVYGLCTYSCSVHTVRQSNIDKLRNRNQWYRHGFVWQTTLSEPVKPLGIGYVHSYTKFLINLMVAYQAEACWINTRVISQCVWLYLLSFHCLTVAAYVPVVCNLRYPWFMQHTAIQV
jgi:hypothetical protein